MKFFIKDFFSKSDTDLVTLTGEILMENYIFCDGKLIRYAARIPANI